MFHRSVIVCLNRSLSVDRFSQRIDDTADHFFSYGYAGLTARARNPGTFHDSVIRSQQYASDHFLFEVLSDARRTVFKFHQFAVHHLLHAVDIGDTVTYADDTPCLLDLHFAVIIFYFAF